ncbi:MAG TPA: hypothetical protein VGH94_13675 [Acidimicrobiales bacterium]|jgi:hypothetical protein
MTTNMSPTVGQYVPGQNEYASDNYIPIPGLDPRIAGRQAAEQAWAPGNTIYPTPSYDLRTTVEGRAAVSSLAGAGRLGAATATPAAPLSASDQGALASLRTMLDGWGLGGLTDWAWQKLTSGASMDQIVYEMRQTDQYKQRFAGNVARQAAGLTPMTEADYLNYEQSARQLFSFYGLPKTFYDQPSDFADFIAKDVSVTELSDRVQLASQRMNAQPEEDKAWARLYGVSTGDQLAYFLDESKALPILQRQAAAANLAGIGTRTGFGDIDRAAAERLAGMGVTADQATQGFGQLAGMKQVTGQIIGDTGPGMTQGEQLGAVFDQNATNVADLSRRQRGRLANFQAPSGTYSQTQGV